MTLCHTCDFCVIPVTLCVILVVTWVILVTFVSYQWLCVILVTWAHTGDFMCHTSGFMCHTRDFMCHTSDFIWHPIDFIWHPSLFVIYAALWSYLIALHAYIIANYVLMLQVHTHCIVLCCIAKGLHLYFWHIPHPRISPSPILLSQSYLEWMFCNATFIYWWNIILDDVPSYYSQYNYYY